MLVDTSVWALALRRRAAAPSQEVEELRTLVHAGRVTMLGAIRQELLSGIRATESFERLRDTLRAFPDEPLAAADYEEAAEYFNACRVRGVQGSNTDFLICAVAARRQLAILTTDADFLRFARVLPIVLHQQPRR